MAVNNEKIRLKGHETFILREGWLSKGLLAVDADNTVFTKNSGADALGVGTNMAKAIKYWLRTGGFTLEPPRQGVKLTQIGKEVLKNDSLIEDDFTLWIFHCNLVCSPYQATSWYLFFNVFDLEEFNRDELFLELRRRIFEFANVTELSERSLNDDCTAILSMYIKEKIQNYDPEDKKISPFARLGLMKKEGNRYQKTQPNFDTLKKEVVMYLIAAYFTENNCNSVSIDDLLKKPCLPGRVLNLNRMMLNDYLDRLSEAGYVSVNRTAGLDMIYQKMQITPLEIVEAYYKI